MQIKKLFITYAGVLCGCIYAAGASQPPAVSTEGGAIYTRSGSFVTIAVQQPKANSPRLVRLQVVGDKIIRVEATAENIFPTKESIIILPQKGSNNYTVNEDNGNVRVKTPSLTASVNKATGRVVFLDNNGRQILAEDERQGKTLTPFTVPEREIGDLGGNHKPQASNLNPKTRHGWTWRLLFDDAGDDGLYGLGQHQANELNMKGKNEDLFQYNTKVSVPFVVSSKGYGILWDSYSYCRFGNPEPYQQLGEVFKLYDNNGNEGHLTGTYTDKDGKTIVRDEDSIYYEYLLPDIPLKRSGDLGAAALPKGFRLNGAHVTYEGYLEPLAGNHNSHTSTLNSQSIYRFLLYYAGYVKVYIDGKEVVPEHWRQAWNPNSCKFEIDFNNGNQKPQTSNPNPQTKMHHILIDWYPDGDVSYCGLRVAKPQPESEQRKLSIWSEMTKDLDYYFIAGDNIDEVIHGYRTLTGKAQVFPKWTLGFWQSRERYKTSGEIEQTLAEFRHRHIPIDNIVQDWSYWVEDQWGSQQFDLSRYPDPQAMIDSVHQMHGRFMISVWPKFYCNTDNYKALDSHGWMYHQAVTDSIRDWIGHGYMGSFYDAYAPGARKMFWQQINDGLYNPQGNHKPQPSSLNLQSKIDAWWMDASEPNVRDCTPMWYRKALCGPTALGTATEYFNAYSIPNADAIYNGQRSTNPNQRVFLLTRSGFAGEQRYSTATWSGDIGTRWEDMRAQMTAGLNYCIAGLPFWGMDIGGFSVENRYVKAQQEYDRTGMENEDLKEWRELQARWNEFGCFVPLYRTHGQWPLREVWNIAPDGHPAYKAIVWYDRLRYRLMPYLYSMAGAVHLNDYTMMRALVMDFNGDPNVYDIKDQWMFGPSLMACPVSEYKARHRSVYLPSLTPTLSKGEGGWFDLYTGRHYLGGQTIVADAPLEKIPVFVPEGSIIPFGPEMEWSDEKPAELINLYVYTGRDASFTLYEDEGTNYNYERGKYATIKIDWNDQSRTLTIGQRKGSFNGMLKNRRFNVVLVSKDKLQPLNLDNPEGKTVNYNGNNISMTL